MKVESNTYVEECHIGNSCCSLCLKICFSTFFADSDPANWVPSVSPRIRMESTIEVKISHSPSSFNLTQFTVILLKRNFDDRNQFKTVYYTEPVSLIVFDSSRELLFFAT